VSHRSSSNVVLARVKAPDSNWSSTMTYCDVVGWRMVWHNRVNGGHDGGDRAATSPGKWVRRDRHDPLPLRSFHLL
jgi:hypothetical protein